MRSSKRATAFRVTVFAALVIWWATQTSLLHSPPCPSWKTLDGARLVLHPLTSQASERANIALLRTRAEANARKGNAKVIYFYIADTGGVDICKLARINGHKTVPNKNCSWYRPADPLVAQIEDFRRSNLTFVVIGSQNLPLHGSLPLPGDLVYVTTIRNPLDRALSFFRQRQREEPSMGGYSLPQAMSLDHFDWAENAYLRFVGACPRVGACNTDAALKEAKRRLEYFSVILITDDFDTYSLTMVSLHILLGWKIYKDPRAAAAGGYDEATGVASDAFTVLQDSPGELAMAVRRNQLDLELYQHARSLAFTRLLKDSLSRNGTNAERDAEIALLLPVISPRQRGPPDSIAVQNTLIGLRPGTPFTPKSGNGLAHLKRVSYRHNQGVNADDFNPRRLVDTTKRFVCDKTVALVGWWDYLLDPLQSFARALQNVSDCRIHTFGTLNKDNRISLLLEKLNGIDIVIWWNWHGPLERMAQARQAFSKQIWVLLNWDDPYSLFMTGDMHAKKGLFDIVFSSSTASLPTYLYAGAKEAHAFVPMVDNSHYYDPKPEFEADVAFAATNAYDYVGNLWNRTEILEALAADARKTGLKLAIYGTEKLGRAYPEFYKGRILNGQNRNVWSSAKISINFHCIDPYDGWYANARNTEILGSRGLLVVDKTVDGPLVDGEECVFWKGQEPEKIVAQVHEILDNYDNYETIRDQGYAFAKSHFSATAHAVRVLEAIARVSGGLEQQRS